MTEPTPMPPPEPDGPVRGLAALVERFGPWVVALAALVLAVIALVT